ncbi:cytoplasmic protein [Leptotrichia sp. OH3620_COT-345]|uniref:cytoplasmic protein n=1 Tax=Leptotrichia sp. OH3620_COT-345 TaxID=2491048 RepID=UPI000F6468CA|nr:cytoplasmic protein [Leptotrichia sp. OH3620_COT-345]RRD39119.1 cytoplasmic protein [Leptotrichia sp. OH3620_COT-345]
MLKKNILYISFHRPRNLIGYLIAGWTLGKYSHTEFIYNGNVYLANPGGIRKQPLKIKKNYDIFKLHEHIEIEDILEFFGKNEGKGYDYLAILGSQFLYFLGLEDKEKYFCSEFCLAAIDYALQYTLTYKGKGLEKRYHKFNPERLYKYLKFMELIKEKEVI